MFHRARRQCHAFLINYVMNKYRSLPKNNVCSVLYSLNSVRSTGTLDTSSFSRQSYHINFKSLNKTVLPGVTFNTVGKNRGSFVCHLPGFSRNSLLLGNVCCMYHNKREFSGQVDLLGQGWLYNGLYDTPPVIYAQDLLLSIHNATGLPWWTTIVLSAVILRTAITFPLALYQNYIIAKLEEIQLEMKELSKEMGKEVALAVKMYNWDEKKAKAVYIRSMKKQWQARVVKENCHPAKTGLLMLVQFPMWLSLSLALRNMMFMLPTPDAAAQATAFQLSEGGALWFHNLLLADTTWMVPILFGLVNLAIIEIQAASRVQQPGRFQRIVSNFMRGVSIVMIPVAASVPTCLSLYWLTSSTVGLIHNLILLSPRVRNFVRIPPTNSTLQHPYKHIYEQFLKRLRLTTPSRPSTPTKDI